jgi:hypothetical protein
MSPRPGVGPLGRICLAIAIVAIAWAWSAEAWAQPEPPPGGPQPGADDPMPAARDVTRPAAREPARKRATPARATPRPRIRPRRQVLDTEDPSISPGSATPVYRREPRRSRRGHPRKGMPVVRAQAGNWGMFFRFGGLASLDHGNNTRTVNGVLLTQVGFRYVVSETLIIPFYFGTGVRLIEPPDPDDKDTKDWAIELGVGIEYHFRIWRRISPFVGFSFGLGAVEPNGAHNTVFGVGLGPSLGVEYYIGDRVSITVMYMMTLQIEIEQQYDWSNDETVKQRSTLFNTAAGGAINIAYYF